ncbi:hypothetical protein [Pyxidicoccus sp. MSG2]|uniref:hypothetical protein n=1 Tax=Pyxidicoccus sp. MSG2 TaxID=2996790 RepID=UPI00226FAA61|nr:hypothetical protein [Pyxidicoccus sp. MSG2]MCY1019900.1 hypothetical protein [Pyxidicoccus sp. MSG2]
MVAALVPTSQARADEEGPPVRHWWEFVVEIDAQHRDGGAEHGHGLIVGQLSGEGCDSEQPRSGPAAIRLACIEKGLLVVTANHLVRRPDGQPAARIQVRSQWDVGGPRMALPLGLFDAGDDTAMVVVPVGEAPASYSVAVGCTDMLRPASRMMLGLPRALFEPLWGSWVRSDEAGRLLFQGLGTIRGGSGAPIIDYVNTVIGISTASEGKDGVSKGIPFDRIQDTLMKGEGNTEVSLTWNVMPTCGCAAQRLMTKSQAEVRAEDLMCTEPGLWAAVQAELLTLGMDPQRQFARRFAATEEDFRAVFVEKVPGSLWANYQEGLANLEPSPTESGPMAREGLALARSMMKVPSLPRCGLIPMRFAKARLHDLQELFISRVELLGLKQDLWFCELDLESAGERDSLLFLALNGRWVHIPENPEYQ